MNLPWRGFSRSQILFAGIILFAALGFRLVLALHLPNDGPDDGRLYSQIAINILDHCSYSIDTEDPYTPTYIRVPGYPLFLAGVYKIFGNGSNRAVRVIQAGVDTLTCWLAAWLALAWMPESWGQAKRRRLMLIALALAACCPYTAIYVTTILTETWAIFLALLCLLAASLALGSKDKMTGPGWWFLAGLAGGALVLFRPDGALFVAAAGMTLLLSGLYQSLRSLRGKDQGSKRQSLGVIGATVFSGIVLTAGFVVVLAPWAIRNARVFKVFQPIAPFDAKMPGEFSPDGYIRWLRSWTRDWKYINAVEWSVDDRHITINQFPDYAFDSPEEKARVELLLNQYNRVSPEIQAKPEPPKVEIEQKDGDDSGDDDNDEPEENPEAKGEVKMTAEIDSAFAILAKERITRQPLRYYLGLPVRRAGSLWFDTHSQYYPFEGELFPWASLDRDSHQQYWLSLFAGVLWLYTILAILGAWRLVRSREAGRWAMMLALIVLPRLMFLSSLENPEPRYVVELFPFIAIAAAFALESVTDQRSPGVGQ